MDLILWHKFTQNRHLKEELLSTGDAELVEVSRMVMTVLKSYSHTTGL